MGICCNCKRDILVTDANRNRKLIDREQNLCNGLMTHRANVIQRFFLNWDSFWLTLLFRPMVTFFYSEILNRNHSDFFHSKTLVFILSLSNSGCLLCLEFSLNWFVFLKSYWSKTNAIYVAVCKRYFFLKKKEDRDSFETENAMCIKTK